ncbi:hypothetical protein WN51_14557 [Melipona quadrifasciata]|uniref:Uncharacterized protein n=1 Tax=Melipona quadrifasciata TaxID=166423 RepID=A0A0M8ZXE2_9HYME|nr:hypothetical protein WN51_14557 [Melipona quadrifasciata]
MAGRNFQHLRPSFDNSSESWASWRANWKNVKAYEPSPNFVAFKDLWLYLNCQCPITGYQEVQKTKIMKKSKEKIWNKIDYVVRQDTFRTRLLALLLQYLYKAASSGFIPLGVHGRSIHRQSSASMNTVASDSKMWVGQNPSEKVNRLMQEVVQLSESWLASVQENMAEKDRNAMACDFDQESGEFDLLFPKLSWKSHAINRQDCKISKSKPDYPNLKTDATFLSRCTLSNIREQYCIKDSKLTPKIVPIYLDKNSLKTIEKGTKK